MTADELIEKKVIIKELNSHLRYFQKQIKGSNWLDPERGIQIARGRIMEIKHLLRCIKTMTNKELQKC